MPLHGTKGFQDMNVLARFVAVLVTGVFVLAGSPVSAADTKSAAAAPRDGQHDFDFNIGTWKTHIRRLQQPLTGSKSWVDGDGIVSVRKIWNGRANLEEIEAETGAGHLEGMTMRLYNARSHQWNLSWANATHAALAQPAYGAFKEGRGEFYDQEQFDGKTILVRQIFSGITADAYHFEQSFSSDRGRTWEPNFIADLARIDTKPLVQNVSAADRNRDFDFNFGHWKTHVSRLQAPLSGSSKWIEYDGTSDVAPVWSGRASVFELQVDGPAGRIEGVGLRLYNTDTHEWSLNWANSRENALGVPTIGTFAEGRGEFVDQEAFDGRQIFIRNVFSNITADASRFEQAFSGDNGKTWETNWIMTFARPK
jgi:hypothetical protein